MRTGPIISDRRAHGHRNAAYPAEIVGADARRRARALALAAVERAGLTRRASALSLAGS
jgi:hypothetical protein